MHLREGEFSRAHTDFFEAFKNYDESGSPRYKCVCMCVMFTCMYVHVYMHVYMCVYMKAGML